MSLEEYINSYKDKRWLQQLHYCLNNLNDININSIVSIPISYKLCNTYPHIMYSQIIEFHHLERLFQTQFKRTVICCNCERKSKTILYTSNFIVPIGQCIPYDVRYETVSHNILCSCRNIRVKLKSDVNIKNDNNHTYHNNRFTGLTKHNTNLQNVDNSSFKLSRKTKTKDQSINTITCIVSNEIQKFAKFMTWTCKDIMNSKWCSCPPESYKIIDINRNARIYKLMSFILCFGYGNQSQFVSIIYKNDKWYCHNDSYIVEISSEKANAYRTNENVYMCFYEC